jgi:hypothetical protein
MIDKRLSHRIFVVIACGVVANTGLVHSSEQKGAKQGGRTVTIAATALKGVYEVGERVPLVLAIANHSSEPVYNLLGESDFRDGFSMVKDANGTIISGDPIPDPNVSLPSYWYMEKDGRRVLTMLLYEIPGKAVKLLVIEDTLRRHRGRIAEGIYFLSLGDIEILHDVEDIIVREGLPERLWVDPTSDMTRVRHPVHDVKVEIRGSPAKIAPASQGYSSIWPMFLIGAVAGMGALYLILLLKKKAISRGKSRAT